jgi:hypothetical protein
MRTVRLPDETGVPAAHKRLPVCHNTLGWLASLDIAD